MQQFLDQYCLHDAEVIGVDVAGDENGTRTPVAIITVRLDAELIWLVYDLYEEQNITTPVTSDVFVTDPGHRQWLYDEVDVLDEPKCRHEILLSSGEVIELTFFQFDMFIHRSPSQALQTPATQSA